MAQVLRKGFHTSSQEKQPKTAQTLQVVPTQEEENAFASCIGALLGSSLRTTSPLRYATNPAQKCIALDVVKAFRIDIETISPQTPSDLDKEAFALYVEKFPDH
jgi:hypothetical protein